MHFDHTTLKDEDFLSDSSSVTYHQSGDNVIDVHLGFLQYEHRYLIELHLLGDLFKCQSNVPINLVADNNVVPNIHCKLADRVTEIYKQTEDFVESSNTNQNTSKSSHATEKKKYFLIKVEYFAHKEKFLREELKLVNANNSEELLKLVVTARVLGKGKGTPMLRSGIHCLGYEERATSK